MLHCFFYLKGQITFNHNILHTFYIFQTAVSRNTGEQNKRVIKLLTEKDFSELEKLVKRREECGMK